MTSPLRKLGPIVSRMMKLVEFQRLQIPVSSGSDPIVESIDDCTEVYGDGNNVIDLFCKPEDDETDLCPRAPAGRCQFDWRDKWRACIHCGREDGPGL